MTPCNMFDTTISEERTRQDLIEDNEHGSHAILRLWTERFGLRHEDAATIVRFGEDIIQTLFLFVDTTATALCLRHTDGTPTTREEQFDLMYMASLPEFRSLIAPKLLLPDGEVLDTSYSVAEVVQNTKYVRVESLRELRRALVEVPGCSTAIKDRAIRQVFDDFVKGLRDDENVSMTIDDDTVELQWELLWHCRPSNQESVAAVIAAHAEE